MPIKFIVGCIIDAAPEDVYKAWLQSASHAKMTGGAARVNARVDAEFQAWDGYISGRNLELDPGRRILQAWRTSAFTEAEADSLLEVLFKPYGARTRLQIRHSQLPAHGMQYKQGWVESYFTPEIPGVALTGPPVL